MAAPTKRILGVLALVVLATAGPAFADPIGSTGSFTWSRQGGYYAGNGGEFTASRLNGLSNADYAAAASNIGNLDPSFQTFCIETNEFVTTNPVYFEVNSAAVNGGAGGPDPDPISQGTAWLYSQFASGALANYFTGTRSVQAGLLQQAIWALEGEGTAGVGNVYYNLAMAHGGLTDAAAGYLGVYVLNNYSDPARTAVAQDFLYYSVPDGGATLALLGGALIGLGALRRKFIA
jgi:hypothetical protein